VIVVAGGSGFIGRTLVSALGRNGADVLAVSRRAASFEPPVQSISMASYAELPPAKPGDTLVHLAEPNDVGAAESNGEDYVDARRASLRELLAKGWGAVVYASSAAVYGDCSAAAHTTRDPVAPNGSYAEAKLACESAVLEAGGSVARLANVYGPGMADNNVVSDILRQIPGAGPLVVRNRKPVRDYLWVEDAADALAALALTRRPGVWNVGSGRGTSVSQLARTALDLAGEHGREVIASVHDETESSLVLDIQETSRELDWRPRISLQDGLARLLRANA
jgi:UDP-glucose 4-epimerase